MKLVLCADLHLTPETPVCRTDNYIETQLKKLNYLIDFANRHYADICCAGDICDKARLSRWFELILIDCFSKLDNDFYCIPGQHDLPNHNIKNFEDSSLAIFDKALNNFIVAQIPFEHLWDAGENFLMTHQLIHKDKKIHDTVKSTKARKLLKDNPDIDLILSGDNHQTFIEEYKGRLLVNPGSMVRKHADQIDHEPCFFLYDTDTKELEKIFFPIKEDVISRVHLDKKEKRDERMENFIKHMRTGYEVSLSLDQNFINYFKKNKTRKSVKEIIMEEL